MNDMSFDPTVGADKEFLLNVVRAIVGKPDAVEVTRKVDDLGVLLILKVDAADMPALIGRGGATVKAIRQLVRVTGAKTNQRINLKVVEPDGSEYRVRDGNDVGPGFGSAESAF